MQHPIDYQRLQADLRMPWLTVAMAATILAVLVLVCQNLPADLRQSLPETTREWLRTLFYTIAIVTFPFTNLLRHIQLRLNQTMPLEQQPYAQAAKRRYWMTIIVSISLIQSPGIYGFVMFYLGDSVNTLTIFTLMSALGLYLYRPKLAEYEALIIALANPHHE